MHTVQNILSESSRTRTEYTVASALTCHRLGFQIIFLTVYSSVHMAEYLRVRVMNDYVGGDPRAATTLWVRAWIWPMRSQAGCQVADTTILNIHLMIIDCTS